MIIQCPKCKAKFKLPDDLFGNREAIRFQCSKCKTIFNFDLIKKIAFDIQEQGSSEETMKVPAGLRAGEPKQEKPQVESRVQPRMDERIKEEGDLEQPTTPVSQGAGRIEESFESFEEEKPSRIGDSEKPAEETIKSYPPPTASPRSIPVTSTIEVQEGVEAYPGEQDEELSGPTPPQGVPAFSSPQTVEQATHRQRKATVPPEPREQKARDLILSAPYILELEYEWAEKPLKRYSHGMRFLGVVAIVVIVLFVIFFIFVSARNEWDFTALFQNPADSINVALGRKTLIKIAPEAKGLDTTITGTYTDTTLNGIKVLVVEGEVFNMTVFPKKQIRVYIEIVDKSGNVVQSQEVISGITLLGREKIKEKTFSEILLYIEKQREVADQWVVNASKKVYFQAFFANPPDGVDDTRLYDIRAIAISAVNASTTPAML